jgi:hypothetical protein
MTDGRFIFCDYGCPTCLNVGAVSVWVLKGETYGDAADRHSGAVRQACKPGCLYTTRPRAMQAVAKDSAATDARPTSER